MFILTTTFDIIEWFSSWLFSNIFQLRRLYSAQLIMTTNDELDAEQSN